MVNSSDKFHHKKKILQIKILETLTKRVDFVAASKAEKFVGNSIIVQAKYNASDSIRVGYTAVSYTHLTLPTKA